MTFEFLNYFITEVCEGELSSNNDDHFSCMRQEAQLPQRNSASAAHVYLALDSRLNKRCKRTVSSMGDLFSDIDDEVRNSQLVID